MKKTIIIIMLSLIFLIPSVLSADSEDRTEYFPNGTSFIADNIEGAGSERGISFFSSSIFN